MKIKFQSPTKSKLSLDVFKEKKLGNTDFNSDLKGGTITVLLSSDSSNCCGGTPKGGDDDCHPQQ